MTLLAVPLPADPAPTPPTVTPAPPTGPLIRAVAPPAAHGDGDGRRRIVATWHVDEHGKPADIRLDPPPGNRDLEDAIRKEILGFRFRPPSRDGKPVPVVLTHTFIIDAGTPPTLKTGRDAPVAVSGCGDLVLLGLKPSEMGKTYTATWTVNADGTAADVRVSPDGSQAVRDAIIASIKRLRFLPATRSGQPVKAAMSHVYRVG